MKSNKTRDNSLIAFIYENAKWVVIGLGVISAAWLFYLNSNLKNQESYNPKKVQDISWQLIGLITMTPQTPISIQKTDPVYQDGLKRLQECGELKSFFGVDYDNYDRLLLGINKINLSISALYQKKYLQNQYFFTLDGAIKISCHNDYKVGNVIDVLDYLDDESELKNLNWREKQVKNLTANNPPFVTLRSNWNGFKNPWRGFDGCIYVTNHIPFKTSNKKDEGNLNVSLVSLEQGNKRYQGICKHPAMYGQANTFFEITEPDKQVITAVEYEENTADSLMSLTSLLDGLTTVEQESTEPAKISINGVSVPVGFNAQLTINPAIQSLSQQLANCITGQETGKVCQDLLGNISIDMKNMEDNALIRQVGIAVVDIPTRKIDALASSSSNCFLASHHSTDVKSDCIPTPETWKQPANKVLENQALYGDYMPGSTIKPIQALAMVRAFPNTVANSENYKTIKTMMARSNTEQVIDVLACQSVSTQYLKQCQGFAQMQQVADSLGLNNVCGNDNKDCGRLDVLRGKELGSTHKDKPIFYGRLMVQAQKSGDDTGLVYAPLEGLDGIPYQNYAKRKINNGGQWLGTKGGLGVLDEAVNQSAGQGDSRVTPLGLANSMANLLALADGDSVGTAYILERLWTAEEIDVEIAENKPKDDEEDSFSLTKFLKGLFRISDDKNQASIIMGENTLESQEDNTITQQQAQMSVNFFTSSHNPSFGGTSVKPCQAVFGSCNELIYGYKVFTKTGTPSFDREIVNINNLTAQCKIKRVPAKEEIDNHGNKKIIPEKTVEPTLRECTLRPIKWHVLGIGQENGKWQKMIVVMADRNWNHQGVINDNTDANNDAAKVGFSLMKAMHQQNLIISPKFKEKSNESPL